MSRRDAGGKHMAPDVEGQGVLHVKKIKPPVIRDPFVVEPLPAGSPVAAGAPNSIVVAILAEIESRRRDPAPYGAPMVVDLARAGARPSRGLTLYGVGWADIAKTAAGGAKHKCDVWLKAHVDASLDEMCNLLVDAKELSLDMVAAILACKIGNLDAVP